MNGVWYFLFGVADREPNVLPWKAFENDTIPILFVFEGYTSRAYLRANLNAAEVNKIGNLR